MFLLSFRHQSFMVALLQANSCVNERKDIQQVEINGHDSPAQLTQDFPTL